MTARQWIGRAASLGLFALLAACSTVGDGRGAGGYPVVKNPAPIVSGTMRPYQVRGRWYTPKDQPNYEEVGLASWYGDAFNGRPTSSGERFDMNALTAAHKTLPLPGLVEVTNLENGRRLVVRINDRGPFVDSRIIDLSREAAKELDLLSRGVGRVRVRYLGPAPQQGGGVLLRASAPAPTSAPAPARRSSVPVATQAPIVTPVSAAETSSFWVQAGVFADASEARRIADSLSGWVRADGEGERYRVVVGPWDSANAAEAARLSVMARGYADALLISGR
ncbi:septal ring lytic transglycosylase RlpA family protein [Brevundimonas sp. SORGH_AS_0993]|uniref:septal ring lytic transglycosylase RlpA family protein n=1 Tax=Brevundimonas sp. SORGH_AS_0993 TaxID=3041794 RepID=UPI002781D241|nr:septal ring lytic transglycosylase RlpA family protein [Brevundimonas sp. SORGH_AS_0993]MDQ1153634.1 rare lipoprotein A [Brevundimonas sp. SORGH_AS_0993]